MGSTKHSDSNRATKPRSTTIRADDSAVSQGKDMHAILSLLSDAIAFVTTVGQALLRAEEHDGTLRGKNIGNELVALEHGIGALRHVYDELDLAIRAGR